MATKKKSGSTASKRTPTPASDLPERAGPTLREIASAYLTHLEHDGAGNGTLSSYGMELQLALRELGETTTLDELTVERIERFNASDAVTKTRHGKPKAQATIAKTRRVLRLAMAHAQAGQERSAVEDPAAADEVPAGAESK